MANDEGRIDVTLDDDESELAASEMLVALARLDAEAAQAYGAAAESIELPDARGKLREFEQDHLRHVADLKAALERIGEGDLARSLEPQAPLLAAFSRMAAPLGPHAVLMTLLNNEQLTNVTYENALAYEWDEESELMLERNRADEERHFDWLSAKHDELAHDEDEEPSASA
jgi:rubrerythrin